VFPIASEPQHWAVFITTNSLYDRGQRRMIMLLAEPLIAEHTKTVGTSSKLWTMEAAPA
jgi:hypothetical protein